MSKKLILACMAVAAFAAFVLPAAASASPRLCETTNEAEPCTNLVPPVAIRAHNVGNWVFTNSSGNIECASAELKGTLTENSGTSVKGDIETATFGGTGTGGDCTGPLGTSVAVDLTEGEKPPWCLSAGGELAADEFQVKGGKCGEVGKSITFKFNITGLNDCWYNRTAAVKGSFTTDTATGEDAILSFSEQEWTLEKETKTSVFAPACPSAGKLDGKATLETNVVGTSPLYIK